MNKSLSAVLLIGIAGLATGGWAQSTTRIAEEAVERLIRDSRRFDRWEIGDSDARPLGRGDFRVTGDGTAWRRGSRSALNFRFNTIVERDSRRARDLVITFADGSRLTDRDDDRPGWDDRVSISAPRTTDFLTEGNIRFEGSAGGNGAVILDIFDRNDRRVGGTSVRPDNRGRWQTQLFLREGFYRARATQTGSRQAADINFQVRLSGDRPGNQGFVQFTSPRNGFTFDTGDVTLRGVASARRSVRLEIVDDSGRRVVDDTFTPNDRDWQRNYRLGSGGYRAVVSQDWDRSEVRFSVRRDWNDGGGDGGWGSDRLAITSPRNGSTVNSSFSVRGTGERGRSIRLEILDDDGRRVEDDTFTPNDRDWERQYRLSSGDYRLIVSQSGRRSDIRIRVNRGGGDDGWGDGGWSGGRVSISSPRNGANVSSGSMSVRGSAIARRSMRVEIFRNDGRRVVDDVFTPNDRDWDRRYDLDSGSYRLVATQDGRSSEVRFTVGRGGGGGWDGDRQIVTSLNITRPASGDRIRGPRVLLEGASSDSSVDITIEQSGRRVWSGSARVDRGIWRADVNLGPGSYRVTVRNRSNPAVRVIGVVVQ